ncbi:DUF968 domain-containing protein [Bradyrhizobium sp. BRP20]|uniref:DUF968 domain-containing protein n=1 Tax=Bradyrhizobium sp. BRP20 TaxID=2793822 RepID=UPI001CD54341|nr:hypothetical protein [Bradyrhizobium sp. BRP20]MCA1437654.1 DUF968 domain-containing protein [Bradyrhizobium sp. BRP20]
MHQSSEHIDTIAAAIARAHAELLNLAQSSLATSFDIVRRTLGRQEIAIIQATRTEQVTGQMCLRTLLAHVSGEWISSDLPVLVDVKAPQSTLTGARHYALLSLVGLIVEDEAIGLSDVNPASRTSADPTKPQHTSLQREVTSEKRGDPHDVCHEDQVLAFPKERPRKRSKAHLAFIRAQGCLVCQKSPVDAHHLKFAQPSTLGRKVSDEFTVPLCRSHHLALHRHGNERAWWTNLQLEPLQVAKELWATSPAHSHAGETSPLTEAATSVEAQRQ